MDLPYRIELVTGLEMVRRIGALFAANGNAKTEAHLRWQYLENAGRGAISAVAISADGTDAAVYSVFFVGARANGVKCLACQSLDTLTDQRHRGKGLFTLLAKAVYEECDRLGVVAVFGFPNASSGPGFFNKLGWIDQQYPPFLISVENLLFPLQALTGRRNRLRIPNIFGRLRRRVHAQIARPVDEEISEIADFRSGEYERLWTAFSTTFETGVVRDGNYMQWRFRNRPRNTYRCLGLWRGGQLVAVAVSVAAVKHGGNVGYLMELIYDPDQTSAAKRLVAHVIDRLVAERVDVILAWSHQRFPVRRLLRSSGFIMLPRFAQPIKLFFGLRPGPESLGQSTKMVTRDFYVSYADSDTV